MRRARVWRELLGIEKAVVERVEYDEDTDVLVAQVRPTRSARGRCGVCRRRCRGYDAGDGRRRWRALDLGTVVAYVEADAPRVACREHGVVVSAVPWARHGAGHTYAFDDTVAWLTVRSSKSAVGELMRVAWRTVGAICTRVAEDAMVGLDRFANLRRIGVDEISYKRGHRYLTVVVDHDTGRLVWAAPGRDRVTLRKFFDALGEQRCAAITHVSADAADWVAAVVAERCPAAIQCADPFHVIKWATEALDEVRRESWNAARGRLGGSTPGAHSGRAVRRSTGDAQALKRSRWALWKNPENLTENQTAKLAWIAKTDPRLHRAYLLKEGLRHVFTLTDPAAAGEALDSWIVWARRCRIPGFVDLQRRIVNHRATIEATLEHGLSNGLIESVNTKIRLLTRIAFGFKNPEALIALAMLALGGLCPSLPARSATS